VIEGVRVLLGVVEGVDVDDAVAVKERRRTSFAVRVAFGVNVTDAVRVGWSMMSSSSRSPPSRMVAGRI
jgi:hypothetical protein